MEQNNVQYAGFWRRVGAWLLDAILFSVVFVAIAFVSSFDIYSDSPNFLEGVVGDYSFIMLSILLLASRFQATPGKALAGVYVVHKADNNYRRPGFFRIVVRQLSGYVILLPFYIVVLLIPSISGGAIEGYPEFLNSLQLDTSVAGDARSLEIEQASDKITPLFFAGGFITMIFAIIWLGMAGWTKEKTALHDIICSTRVIKGKP